MGKYPSYLTDYFPRELDMDAEKFAGYVTLTPTGGQYAQCFLLLPIDAGKIVVVDEVRAHSTAGGVVKIGLYSTTLTSLETDVAANRGAMDTRIGTGEAVATIRAKDNASALVFTHGVFPIVLAAAGAAEYLPNGWVMESMPDTGVVQQLVVEGPASADLTVAFTWYEMAVAENK